MDTAGLTRIFENDGPSAIETFAERNPSVILLDISMPKMDG